MSENQGLCSTCEYKRVLHGQSTNIKCNHPAIKDAVENPKMDLRRGECMKKLGVMLEGEHNWPLFYAPKQVITCNGYKKSPFATAPSAPPTPPPTTPQAPAGMHIDLTDPEEEFGPKEESGSDSPSIVPAPEDESENEESPTDDESPQDDEG